MEKHSDFLSDSDRIAQAMDRDSRHTLAEKRIQVEAALSMQDSLFEVQHVHVDEVDEFRRIGLL